MFKPGLAVMKVVFTFQFEPSGKSHYILGIIILSLAPDFIDHNYDLTKQHIFGNFMVSKYFLNWTMPSKILCRSFSRYLFTELRKQKSMK